MNRLEGKSALITGAARGIGKAYAQAYILEGARVAIADVNFAAAQNAAGEIGSQAWPVHMDVSDQSSIESAVADAEEHLNGIDILINNAVVRHFAPIVDFPTEKWDAALAVNLSAAFHAIRCVLPGMREKNYGRIFNITSVYGLRGTTERVGYVTTKSALLGLTRAVALENLEYDVTCHSICPGSVLTPGTEGRIVQMMTDEGVDRSTAERRFLEGKQPGGEFVRPESVAATLLFLCGPVARDMTGAMLPVEGGWLAS